MKAAHILLAFPSHVLCHPRYSHCHLLRPHLRAGAAERALVIPAQRGFA
jgi:hypothetical protein